jgi:ABC-type phosphate/phosphonate transport system substrate-binding protein
MGYYPSVRGDATPKEITFERGENMNKRMSFVLLALIVSVAMILSACGPAATEAPAPEPEPVEAPTEEPQPEPTEEPMAELGSPEHPIKVLFVPSVDVDFMIESGDLIAQALNEATGLTFEVSVPTSYAATIEEMCASPDDTIGFIPALGYVLANQLCGVQPGLAAERRGWNVSIGPASSSPATANSRPSKTWQAPSGLTRMPAPPQVIYTPHPSF